MGNPKLVLVDTAFPSYESFKFAYLDVLVIWRVGNFLCLSWLDLLGLLYALWTFWFWLASHCQVMNPPLPAWLFWLIFVEHFGFWHYIIARL
jgi:hypothetical protein